jgi:ATP/maltotriose-dependent transcriptional regulator MalT
VADSSSAFTDGRRVDDDTEASLAAGKRPTDSRGGARFRASFHQPDRPSIINVLDAITALERGRGSYASGSWSEAFESLASADQARPLDAEDRELLARAAYMLGRDDDYVNGLERAHQAYLDTGDPLRAVRCTFWVGHNLLFRGERARASGWFGRGRRLLAGTDRDCVERGYLLIPVSLEQMGRGDWEAAYATTLEAAEIGERFGDRDLLWLARDDQGAALIKQGRVAEGLRLVDEVLVAATAGELSPIVTGIVYCNTIAFCWDAYELHHAREWTEALTQWCDAQPEMVAHNGLCLVHRAEIMQVRGAWANALEEARRAAQHFTQGVLNQLACGTALYRQGEVHRLRGELSAAEHAYREASRCGCEPQPGLALLRLAQGEAAAAAAAIRRAVGETTQPLGRAALLPAYVEIMLAVGEGERASAGSRELEEIAERQTSDALLAMAAHVQGAAALAEGDARGALMALRRAFELWQELEAPYEAARQRVLIGSACRALGDEDTATLEFEAAREVFMELGATWDLARVDSLVPKAASLDAHGLTKRELEVLRLVAAGNSNREIASVLVISEHTVARHLQNIFAKLGVSSRTGASEFAFEHELVRRSHF